MRATKQEITQVLGELVVRETAGESLRCEGIEFDSRKIRGGELFVALPGEVTHGNKFAEGALKQGSALCLVEAGQDYTLSGLDQERLVVVSDSLKAFSLLAQWWRKKNGIPTVGITGSVGKTSLKEMTARLLMQQGRGLYSQKSFNNHVGVPYTLCAMRPEHLWCVLEMGMNHYGELRHLTHLAHPDHAVITKIAPAHIEFFGSLENICKAKLEIVEGLSSEGTVILNADDPILLQGFDQLPPELRRVPVYFGKRSEIQKHGRELSAWYDNVKSHLLDGISFNFGLGDESAHVKMKIIGIHNAQNAACAALAARSVAPGLSFASIVESLEQYVAPLMRLDIRECRDGTRIIDDSYNANPESMGAMLKLAQELCEGGLSVGLVLGDMKEMGFHSAEAHAKLGDAITSIPASFTICVGEEMKTCFEVLKQANSDATHVAGAGLAARFALARQWDVLFVKGSRGIGLDQTVEQVLSSKGEIFTRATEL